MGRHSDLINSYFDYLFENYVSSYCLSLGNNNSMETFNASSERRTLTGFICKEHDYVSRFTVEELYLSEAGEYPELQEWELEFLVDMEEIHDYYAALEHASFPISFSDYILAAYLIAVKWDGTGEVRLAGEQVFKISVVAE